MTKIRTVLVWTLIMGLTWGLSVGLRGTQAPQEGLDVVVKQEPGKVFYWVLPGERRLSKQVFGTPANPLRTGETQIKRAKGPMKDLLSKFPFLVGAPLEMRATNMEGTRFTKLKVPTLFSDQARITSGQFSVTYRDRQPYDTPGKPIDTLDDADFSASFTDPAGNRYQIKLKRVFMPPIPGYETGGGVITNAWHHGITGTGSPLMPRVYTFGAFWGFGDVVINGEVSDTNKVIHLMTTQIVRDKNYHLAIDQELPLAKENTIAGQTHHTHLVVLPIKITPEGPIFEPVNTAYVLPNGKKQPFIHAMWEQDTILKGPFKGQGGELSTKITVKGSEFSFEPSEIKVKKGQEVTVIFKNVGILSHNFVIGELGVKTETIPPGEWDQVRFTPGKTGTFKFWCSVPGHREAGMEGKLTIAG